MKKRKVHETRFEPRKQPRILNTGAKLESSATNPAQQEESSLRYSSLSEVKKVDIIPHLNLRGKDKSDPNSPETKAEDAIHHHSPRGKDKNDTVLKTPAATPVIEPEKTCRKFHPIYRMLCANIALDHYNTKYNTKFELVKDEHLKYSLSICSYDTSYDRSYATSILCSFNAKDGSSTKMFSARLDYVYDLGLKVAVCKFSEDGVDLSDKDKNSADDSLNPDAPEYTPVSVDYDPGAIKKDCRVRSKRIAEIALNHYNDKIEKGAKYKLQKNADIGIRLLCDTDGDWFHCWFLAVDSSTQQDNKFFAELKYNYPSKPVFYSCKKLIDGDTTHDCDCKGISPKFDHPASKDGGKYIRDVSNVQKDTPPKNEILTVPHPYDYWGCFGIYKDPRETTSFNAGDPRCRDCRLFGIVFANLALRYYNSKNGSSFRLVQDGSLDSIPYTTDSSGISISCTFIAQRSYYSKSFSAIVEYASPSGLAVTSCDDSEIPENDEEDPEHGEDYAGKVKDIADASSATTPAQQEESSLRYSSLCEMKMADIIRHLNPVRPKQRNWSPFIITAHSSSQSIHHHSPFIVTALKSSATTPAQQEESSLRYSSSSEVKKVDIIPHLNLRGEDKSDPNSPETKAADAIHHHSPRGKDKNDTVLKTPAATPVIEPEKTCRKFHPIYRMLCANIALDHYNTKYNTKFELVKDEHLKYSLSICSYDTSYDRSYATSILCSFNAKDGSSTKMFSARLDYVYDLGLKVAVCKFSEGKKKGHNRKLFLFC